MVGASPSECDTIPGRQCMASCFFILKQFDDVLVYLKSIRPYFQNEDDFNWNFGIAGPRRLGLPPAARFRKPRNAKYAIRSMMLN